MITNVIHNFPAYDAGIRDGDFILEVNGESVTRLPHNTVLKKINLYPDCVDLLVVKDLNLYFNENARKPIESTNQKGL